MRRRLLASGLALALVTALLIVGPRSERSAAAATPAPGTVTTVAGIGQPVSISHVNSIARHGDQLYVGRGGELLVRDLGSQTAQRLATLEPSTVVWSIAVDSVGNVYVASDRWADDHGEDCLVRRIDAATRVMTTVAGMAGAACALPTTAPEPATASPIERAFGLVVSADDSRLYAAMHERVVEIDLDAGTHRTVAGSGAHFGSGHAPVDTRFGGIMGLAYGPDGALYVHDANLNSIHRIPSDWSTVESVVGSLDQYVPRGHVDGPVGGAEFDFGWSPGSITFVDDHTLVVGDENNRVVRSIALDGSFAPVTVSTVIGQTGVRGNSGDGGPAVDATIQELRGLVADGSGGFYLALGDDGGSAPNVLRHVDAAGTVVDVTAVGNGDGGLAVAAALSQPMDLARVGDILYVADNAGDDATGGVVRAIDLTTGIITTLAGTGVPGYEDLGQLTAIAYDPTRGAEGSLLVSGADFYVRRIDLATGVMSTFAGNGTFGVVSAPTPALAAPLGPQISGIAVAPDGRVFLADNLFRHILCIGCEDEDVLSVYAGTGARGTFGPGQDHPYSVDGDRALEADLVGPTRVVVAPDGAVVFADAWDIFSVLVPLLTLVSSGQGPCLGIEAECVALGIPVNIDWSDLGDPAFLDSIDIVDSRVRRIDPVTTEITTIAGVAGDARGVADGHDGGVATAASLAGPGALRFDADGDLFIGEIGGRYLEFMTGMFGMIPISSLRPNIRKVDMSTGVITTVAGNGQGGYSGDGGPATSASFHSPMAIAPDAGTHLYVADSFNARIRRIEGIRPNLVATVSDARLAAGTTGSLVVNVENVGIGTATGPIGADVQLPASLTFVSAAGDGWSCTPAGSRVTCSRPAHLASGASTSFGLVVKAAATGSGVVTVTATVGSDSDDADDSNKVAVAAVEIEHSSPPPTSPPPTSPPPPNPAPNPGPGGRSVDGAGMVRDGTDATRVPAAARVVGMASTPDGKGAWIVDEAGGVFTSGTAPFLGSLAGAPLLSPVRAIAATPSGAGYWLVAADGGVFTFGDAAFYGSLGGIRLNEEIVGLTPTPAGDGYWLIAADGGVFTFGAAAFHASLGGVALNAPITGGLATPSGGGYWLVAADGGIFTFGDAPFLGSLAGQVLQRPVVDARVTASGQGYWLFGGDGGVFTFGDAPWFAPVPADDTVAVLPG